MSWHLPPWRGHAILHADLLAAGEMVVWADRDEDPDIIAFRALRDRYRKGRG